MMIALALAWYLYFALFLIGKPEIRVFRSDTHLKVQQPLKQNTHTTIAFVCGSSSILVCTFHGMLK